MSLSAHIPLPPKSPSIPWAVQLARSPARSPSLPTLLAQHGSSHYCCPTDLGEPTPTSVYLPQSSQPFPSHPLSFAGSVLILHRRSLKVHVSPTKEEAARLERYAVPQHSSWPGDFPLQGLCLCQPHCLKYQPRSFCLRRSARTCLQCLTSSVMYLLSRNARDPIQAQKHTLETSALPLSYIPTTDRQGKLYPTV